MSGDSVILVDSFDQPLGTMDKLAAHLGDGRLHRAFSVHVKRADGRFLLQRRAAPKMLWPGYWSNSCCSHPRNGESVTDAAERRLKEELNLATKCRWLYAFEYHATFDKVGAEHEFCHVLIADCDEDPDPNPEEVSSVVWRTADEISAAMATDPVSFTPWFHMEWDHICQNHPNALIAKASIA